MSDTTQPCLLLVDDEPNVISALRRTLRTEAWHIESTSDPEQAAELAKQCKPAVILCDMRMPGMNGAQVLAQVHRVVPLCTKLLLTGHADLSSTIDAINSGHVDRYLTKPWDDAELKQVLRHAFALNTVKLERDHLAQSLTVKVKELEHLNTELDQRVAMRTAEIAQANLFLENAYQELQAQFLSSVKVFANLLELSSPALAGHGRRVGELARLLAIEMGLPESEVHHIHVAGLLHDLGKIGLTEKVLTTPFTLLEPVNRMALAKHGVKGQTALLPLPDMQTPALYIRHHHERLDGQGYPDGLSGTSIPRGARVLAVAEDFDELQQGWLSANRLAQEDALAFILAASGKRYDPDVVAALPLALEKLEAAPRDDEQLVDSHQLIPGMVLTRDLVNHEGLLVAAKGTTANTTLVQHLRELHSTGQPVVKVYCKAVKPVAPMV